MSLHLDARQRAMLQEMGVHVWSPAPVAVMASYPAEVNTPALALHTVVPNLAPEPAAPTPISAHRPAIRQPTVAVPPPSVPYAEDAGPAVLLHPPQRLFAHAGAQGTPPALGAAWLLIAEGRKDIDPLAGDAGALLRNMLRALQLHQHPRIFFCGVELATDALPDSVNPPSSVLAQALAEVQPTLVLLMGRLAARTVLHRTEPLGQLRAQPHSVLGYPAIVTYDAPYLLRMGKYKAAAWADLCLARALVQARHKA